MNSLPWFKCNATEILYGEQTTGLSDADLGLFIKLRALCWLHEGLPLDEGFLKRALRRTRLPAAAMTYVSAWPEKDGRRFDPDILQQLISKRQRAERLQKQDGVDSEASLKENRTTHFEANDQILTNGINKSMVPLGEPQPLKSEREREIGEENKRLSVAGEVDKQTTPNCSHERILIWKNILQKYSPELPLPDDEILRQLLECVPPVVTQDQLSSALNRLRKGGVFQRMKSWALLKSVLPQELSRPPAYDRNKGWNEATDWESQEQRCPTCHYSMDMCRCRYNPHA